MAARGERGEPYYVTDRLIAVADNDWMSFDGWCAARSIDPLMLPLDRFVNLIYHWATDGADPDEVEKWRVKLWIPPKGHTAPLPPESPWSPESEMSALAEFRAETGL